MANPLFQLAQNLALRAERRRNFRRLKEVQSDPHIARDVGLPYRPRPHEGTDRW